MADVEEGAEEEAQTEEVEIVEEAADEAVQSKEPPETTESGTDERYSINKVQIRKSRFPTKNNELNAYYLTSVPELPLRASEYFPIPYTFRVPTLNSPVKINNLRSKCPPYYLLLDHTIAVLWLMFAAKQYDCPLGISQMQWALCFLRTIKTRNGDYPKDVAIAINAIEELLVTNYAQLSAEMANIKRLDETIKYSEGAFGSSQMLTKELPFSLNYAEMFSKSPAVQAAAEAKSMTSVEAERELKKIKSAAGVDSIEELDPESRNKAINVLKMWKTDQVDKIKDELRRLRAIEENLRDIDANFEGFVEDDLGALASDI